MYAIVRGVEEEMASRFLWSRVYTCVSSLVSALAHAVQFLDCVLRTCARPGHVDQHICMYASCNGKTIVSVYLLRFK